MDCGRAAKFDSRQTLHHDDLLWGGDLPESMLSGLCWNEMGRSGLSMMKAIARVVPTGVYKCRFRHCGESKAPALGLQPGADRSGLTALGSAMLTPRPALMS